MMRLPPLLIFTPFILAMAITRSGLFFAAAALGGTTRNLQRDIRGTGTTTTTTTAGTAPTITATTSTLGEAELLRQTPCPVTEGELIGRSCDAASQSGQSCSYNHIYVGCGPTDESLACVPIVECMCDAFGNGMWMCKSAALAPNCDHAGKETPPSYGSRCVPAREEEEKEKEKIDDDAGFEDTANQNNNNNNNNNSTVTQQITGELSQTTGSQQEQTGQDELCGSATERCETNSDCCAGLSCRTRFVGAKYCSVPVSTNAVAGRLDGGRGRLSGSAGMGGAAERARTRSGP